MPTPVAFYTEWIRPAIAEFFGQLLFTFFHSSAANTISYSTNSTLHNNALVPAISDGLTLATLIVIIGSISGCHVNFSVTTAVFLGGGISWKKVPIYLLAQVLGSLSGAGIALVTNGGAYGYFSLRNNVTPARGYLMEVMMSTFFILTILLSVLELNANLAALAIGFAVIVDILGGFNVSGGCMNPTLSIGPAVVSGKWSNYWVYWFGPLTGAILAALIFRFFLGGKTRLLFTKNRRLFSVSDSFKAKTGSNSREENVSQI